MIAFSFFDKKAGSYGLPQFFQNTAECLRNLTVAVNNSQAETALSRFSSDFDLFCLGEWDYDRATIDQSEPPTFILNIGTLKEAPNAQG